MHEVRYIGLAIAVLAHVQVEHELNESAVELRQSAGHHHEPRAGDSPRRFEIHPEPLADRHMILRRERQPRRFAPAAHFDVRRLIASLRHARMQDIRQPELQTRSSAWIASSSFSTALQCRAERIAHGQQGCGILPCRLGLAHGFGIGVALRAQADRPRSASALRCSSRAANRATSSSKPRRASSAATPCKSLRSSFGSSTLESLKRRWKPSF